VDKQYVGLIALNWVTDFKLFENLTIVDGGGVESTSTQDKISPLESILQNKINIAKQEFESTLI